MEKSDRLIISIASFWEITIKMSLKKLVLSTDIASMTDKALFNGFEIMPIKWEHLIALSSLEYIHRDPFDRIIIAQAIAEKLPIVSSDSIFKQYSVSVIR
jgi:PIN domain nuclease of toxin-antitoxin system